LECRQLKHGVNSRIRSFKYNASLTSLAFAPDGTALFIGTDSGQLLVQNLRTAESPKFVHLDGRIDCIAITVRYHELSQDLELQY
jgi:WD40 repeat protein